jgi:hypothetical protein
MENTMQDLEEAIRARAYQLWIESGCQDGQADAHWLAAQREILGASLGAVVAEKTEKPKKTRRKRAA